MILRALTDVAPFRDLALDLRRESVRRAADGVDAFDLEAFEKLRRLRRLCGRRGELVDHGLRRARGRHQADPQNALVTGQAHLGDGWNIRHQLGARTACERECTQFSGGDVLV